MDVSSIASGWLGGVLDVSRVWQPRGPGNVINKITTITPLINQEITICLFFKWKPWRTKLDIHPSAGPPHAPIALLLPFRT